MFPHDIEAQTHSQEKHRPHCGLHLSRRWTYSLSYDNRDSVACAGAGYFAQFHNAAWQGTKGAHLVAVADRDPGAAVPDGVDRHTNLASLLDGRRIDILDIATPPETHVAMIEQAVAAGVTRIIC